MSTLGKTFSKDPTKDKVFDEVAIGNEIADDLEVLAVKIRSRNQRLLAIVAGGKAQKSGSPADDEKAA